MDKDLAILWFPPNVITMIWHYIEQAPYTSYLIFWGLDMHCTISGFRDTFCEPLA